MIKELFERLILTLLVGLWKPILIVVIVLLINCLPEPRGPIHYNTNPYFEELFDKELK
jgi:hypothetical protein